jgi:hypothetical protein
LWAGQVAGEKTQSKGKMRKSLVRDTFPCQPHAGLMQEIFSSPNILMASTAEREALEHFR